MEAIRFAVFLILALTVASVALPAAALTFKKGQVLGSDGEFHDGASPARMEALIKKAEEDGGMAGISGTNLYVVIEGEVTFVPLSDVRGKT